MTSTDQTAQLILTDYETKVISLPANLKAMQTQALLDLHKQMFHTMMCSHVETSGGYAVFFDSRAVEAELKERNALP